MLRYVSPVQMTARAITEDASSASMQFAAGDFIMLLLASGNRDPAQFEDPERFDIARTPEQPPGTGLRDPPLPRGPLARMETQVALAHVGAPRPGLTLATDAITYKSNIVLRCITAFRNPSAARARSA